jgi:hypothetical protein
MIILNWLDVRTLGMASIVALPCLASPGTIHPSVVRLPPATIHPSVVRLPPPPIASVHPQADPSHPTINQTRTTTYHHPTGDPSEFFWFCDATFCSHITTNNQSSTNQYSSLFTLLPLL